MIDAGSETTGAVADAASDGADTPADVASPADAPPAADGAANTSDTSDTSDAVAPDVPDVPDAATCEACGAPCEAGPAALVATAASPTAVLALVGRPDGALVAWLDGEAVVVHALDPSGAPYGDAVVVDEAGPTVSTIEATQAAEGFALFWSRGLLDTAASPADVTLLQARVGLDGALLMAPAPVMSGLELGRGSGAGDAGFRLWGLRDELDPDEGQVYRQASMARLSVEGAVDGVHYMLSQHKFTYLRVHHSGNQLNTPFVGPTADQPVAYFLASIYLPGCGLPTEPVLALGPSATLAATGFISPQDALWAVRDGSSSTGRLVFHDVATRESVERPLPFQPSERAELATDAARGQALLVDAVAGELVGAGATPSSHEVGPAQVVTAVPPGETVLALRVAPIDGAWLSVWVTSPGGTIHAQRICDAP